MPHHPDDSLYPHLPLILEEPNPDRRRPPAPPQPPPNRGGRQRFSEELRTGIDHIESEAAARPAPPAGVQPHLVFRVPLAASASPQVVSELLSRLNIEVVAIEPDKAVIAFRDDLNLSEFRQAVDTYEQGPRAGINPRTNQPFASTQWDLLQYIEAPQMRLWGRNDRIGPRLRQLIGDTAQSIDLNRLYTLDVEFWHRGTDAAASQSLREIRTLIQHRQQDGERFCDSFVGELLCLARVIVRGAKLASLLDLDVIAELDCPPEPVFDHHAAALTTPGHFPPPPPPAYDGPNVCIVDSGVTTNHPLLAQNIGHAEAIVANSQTASDEHGHGTMVGAIAVFGDVRAAYESGSFSSPVTLFSARVLNAENQFDDMSLIIHQMERAVEFFSQPPYNCRVFNVSLGDSTAWLETNTRQSIWAECLDILARERDVLFVLSAGNHEFGIANCADDAEAVATQYPDYLFQPACGLTDPATAAIPITVGGIAQHDNSSVRRGVQQNDLTQPIAAAGQPTPTTRIGPGINGAIKPEFVAAAGNVAFDGCSSARFVSDNPGLAVMSFSNHPTERLFTYGIGTSLAAPNVARTAAILWHQLRERLDFDPHPNLVRAILATAAHVPAPLQELIHPQHGEDGVRRVCGYGVIDEDLALQSADRRVTLIAQGTLTVDTFLIYEVPFPIEFRQAPGTKTVTVALAFDPPVRRRRSEYLGIRMDYAIIRGKTIEEIVEAYRAVSTEERESAKSGGPPIQAAFRSPFRCDLDPGPNLLRNSTLQRSEWTFQRPQDYGDSCYLVVRAQRVWAPDIITHQDFAVAVILQADEPRLYNLVRNRIDLRVRQRARRRS